MEVRPHGAGLRRVGIREGRQATPTAAITMPPVPPTWRRREVPPIDDGQPRAGLADDDPPAADVIGADEQCLRQRLGFAHHLVGQFHVLNGTIAGAGTPDRQRLATKARALRLSVQSARR